MKFSHDILHTYSFILCLKTKKSKICENWVADMVVGSLKKLIAILTNTSSHNSCFTRYDAR